MNTTSTPTSATPASTDKKQMSRRRLVGLVTAGALAVGLTIGGVATAYATEHPAQPSHSSSPSGTPTAGGGSDAAGGGSHAGGGTGGNGGGGVTPVSETLTPADLAPVLQSALGRTMYPNARFEPVPGTNIFVLGQQGGQSEQYIDAHGDYISIGVAHGDFASEQSQIAPTATRLTGHGSAAVYQLNGGTANGDIEIFANGYWISLSSNLLTTPGNVAAAVQAVLQALPM